MPAFLTLHAGSARASPVWKNPLLLYAIIQSVAWIVLIGLIALVVFATVPAHADIESEHLANFEHQKWWVGKDLEVGDMFIYNLCDPDTFSGLYGWQPWNDRCHHISLHFVTLLLGSSGPEWVVQTAIVNNDGNRQYDVYNIDGNTMQINGLTNDRETAKAVQRTIFGLTDFTAKDAKPLIVGESWGIVSSAISPPINFVVRDVAIDNNDREVFRAGYTTTSPSLHRITLNEPFPLGADVHDPHRLQPGSDRIYSYDLVWRGNSFSDDFNDDDWFAALGGLDTGAFKGLPRPAADPGAAVFDFCTLDSLEPPAVVDDVVDLFDDLDLIDDLDTEVLDDAAEYVVEVEVEGEVDIPELQEDTQVIVDVIEPVIDVYEDITVDEVDPSISGVPAFEYCVDLLNSEGLTVIQHEFEPLPEVGIDVNFEGENIEDEFFESDFPEEEILPDPGLVDLEGDSFDFPEDEALQEFGPPEFEDVQPGLDLPEIETTEEQIDAEQFGPELPGNFTEPEETPPVAKVVIIEEEDTVPDETIPDEDVQDTVPDETIPETTNKDGDILSGIIDGITGFFGSIMGFFGGIGDMFEDLVGAFVAVVNTVHVLEDVPAAYAQSDDDNVVQRLINIINGNGTADDIRDNIKTEIPNIQDLLESGNDGGGPALDLDDFVWIPTKMIEGLAYEGMILLDEAANNPRTVILASSDSDVLGVEREIVVQAGRNSAIFEIVAKSGGTAKVYAAMGGEALSTDDGTVYGINTDPYRIILIAPNTDGSAIQDDAFSLPDGIQVPDGFDLPDGINSFGLGSSASTAVGTDTVPVFIYVLDQNAAPAVVDADIVLSLGASAGITIPETVVIPAGTDHAKLVAGIDRSGTVHAAAPGLLPHTINIDRTVDEINVMLAVAPTVIAKGSAAYYYVWLERDGKPYKPNQVMDVQLTSSDRSVAGFNRAYVNTEIARYGNIDTIRDRVVTVQMTDGLARGFVYTGDRGIATLTASISQYGTASYGVHVGATSISDAGLCAEADDDESIPLGRQNPTNLIVWLLPAVTDSVAYAVVAQYSIMNVEAEAEEPDERFGQVPDADTPLDNLPIEEQQGLELFTALFSLSQGALGAGIFEEGCVATPVQFTNQFITMSSDGGGVVHDGTYDTLHQHGIKGAAVEFPIKFLTAGEHTIRVVGNEIGVFGETEDLTGSWTEADEWEATVRVENTHIDDYSLGITTLPFDSNGTSEVAMVHLQDGQGSMVDTNSLPLRTQDLIISQAASDFGVSRYSNAFVLSASLNKTDGVAVSTVSLAPVSRQLAPSDETVGTHIDMPGAVHIGEEFPYTIHEVNRDGVPLRLTTAPDVSLGDGVIEGSNGRFVAEDTDGTGTITVLGIGEPVTETIEVGKNELDFEAKLEDDDHRVGETILLRLISDVVGVDYTIAWPSWLEYEEVGDNEYEITPTRENNGTINIIGEKKGYGTESHSVNISAIHEVNLSARAEAGGRSLALEPEITNIEGDGAVDPPYTGPPIYVRVAYPIEHVTTTGDGYLFTGVEIDGEFEAVPEFEKYVDKDVRMVGQYERQIFINIADAEGSGVFRTGDEIHIRAPDKPKLLFFITDVFSHWEGDLSGRGPGPFVLIAEKDLNARAVYVEDHSTWMGLVFVAVAAVAALSVFRKSDRLKWMFGGMSGMGKMKPKKKEKKPAKESGVTDGADDGA